jgi:TPR repeat protein
MYVTCPSIMEVKMKIVRPVPMLLLLALLTATTAAASLESGVKAYKKGDFPRALKDFKADASKISCYNLGLMHYKGEGVKANRREAVRWFRKSAEMGHSQAQFIIGTMYDKGEDLAKDPGEAFAWYLKAAAKGHMQAQFNVGYMYTMGEGVKKDRNEAAGWLKKAAVQGHERAQKMLKVFGEEAQSDYDKGKNLSDKTI